MTEAKAGLVVGCMEATVVDNGVDIATVVDLVALQMNLADSIEVVTLQPRGKTVAGGNEPVQSLV